MTKETHPDLFNYTRSERMVSLAVLYGAMETLYTQFENNPSRDLLDARGVLLYCFVAVANDIWTDTPRASEIARDMCEAYNKHNTGV